MFLVNEHKSVNQHNFWNNSQLSFSLICFVNEHGFFGKRANRSPICAQTTDDLHTKRATKHRECPMLHMHCNLAFWYWISAVCHPRIWYLPVWLGGTIKQCLLLPFLANQRYFICFFLLHNNDSRHFKHDTTFLCSRNSYCPGFVDAENDISRLFPYTLRFIVWSIARSIGGFTRRCVGWCLEHQNKK